MYHNFILLFVYILFSSIFFHIYDFKTKFRINQIEMISGLSNNSFDLFLDNEFNCFSIDENDISKCSIDFPKST